MESETLSMKNTSLLDRELNQLPFGVWDNTHPTEPHSPGQARSFYYYTGMAGLGLPRWTSLSPCPLARRAMCL